ncbi:MAG: hypothetical protein QMC67_13135 [Candidatus Wallbacteria bacterium]
MKKVLLFLFVMIFIMPVSIMAQQIRDKDRSESMKKSIEEKLDKIECSETTPKLNKIKEQILKKYDDLNNDIVSKIRPNVDSYISTSDLHNFCKDNWRNEYFNKLSDQIKTKIDINKEIEKFALESIITITDFMSSELNSYFLKMKNIVKDEAKANFEISKDVTEKFVLSKTDFINIYSTTLNEIRNNPTFGKILSTSKLQSSAGWIIFRRVMGEKIITCITKITGEEIIKRLLSSTVGRALINAKSGPVLDLAIIAVGLGYDIISMRSNVVEEVVKSYDESLKEAKKEFESELDKNIEKLSTEISETVGNQKIKLKQNLNDDHTTEHTRNIAEKLLNNSDEIELAKLKTKINAIQKIFRDKWGTEPLEIKYQFICDMGDDKAFKYLDSNPDVFNYYKLYTKRLIDCENYFGMEFIDLLKNSDASTEIELGLRFKNEFKDPLDTKARAGYTLLRKIDFPFEKLIKFPPAKLSSMAEYSNEILNISKAFNNSNNVLKMNFINNIMIDKDAMIFITKNILTENDYSNCMLFIAKYDLVSKQQQFKEFKELYSKEKINILKLLNSDKISIDEIIELLKKYNLGKIVVTYKEIGEVNEKILSKI